MNQELLDKGLKVRREVLGAEYVDNALKAADNFTRPIQELVTQMAWVRSGHARGWTGTRAAS